MEWLEIIELRTVDKNRKSLKSRLQELTHEVDMETKKRAIKVSSHATMETGFSIHLFHDSEMVEHFGSRLGFRLATALREFGPVNHGIWIEMHGI